MPAPVSLVALLLFGSGACGLVYQAAWLRELRFVFGASTAASAAVLAVFMGGLGLGGWVLGRRVAKHPRPLELYANLELGVAGSAALTPLFISLVRSAYIGLGGTAALGMGGGTVVRLVLSTLVLLVPTFLMGGTLPAAVQAVESAGDVGRRRSATLYAANTIGAVVGTLLSTFALSEILGTRKMLIVACTLNALVAMTARFVSRRLPAVDAGPTQPEAAQPAIAPPRFVLFASAVVGFAFLLMELVWYRMLGPILGGSSFTFGLILAVALSGIGIGGALYSLFWGQRSPTLNQFAWTCALEGLLIALPYALGDRVALLAAMLRSLGALGFGGQVAGWAVVSAAVVLPAAIVSGLQFPLLIALLGRGAEGVGRHVGLAYAWNTVGAIFGSLAGGFGLIPLLGAPSVWRAVTFVLAVLGLVTLGVASKGRFVRGMLGPLVAIGVAMLLTRAVGPTVAWRHGGIGVDRGPQTGNPNSLHAWRNNVARTIRWEVDGVESSVALDGEVGYAFIVNGKVDGNARGDAPTQVMGGMLGAILHPNVHRAMVIGLGTGSTAGWLGSIPAVERVDVAELEPAIVRVAADCAPVNRDVVHNPKVHLFAGDARELLQTSSDRYDLIFSEPSNPYRAGVSSLFTRDFYQTASKRLDDGGVFLQWVQAYNVDAQTVRSIYATLQTVFPNVETWVTEEPDLLLVASKKPLHLDAAALRAKIATDPYRQALASAWRVIDLEGVLAHYAARSSLAQAIAPLEEDNINTDDLNLVEFGFARSVGRRERLFNTNDLRMVARARREDRPEVTGEVDWARVDRRRVSMLTAQESAPTAFPLPLSPADMGRARAEAAWLGGDHRAALSAWNSIGDPPEDPVEVALVAESLAETGDDAARPWIERVGRLDPTEGAVYAARLALRQGQLEVATGELEAAIQRYRDDPWPPPMTMLRALGLTREVAARDRRLGERLYQILKKRFAVAMLDEQRHKTLVELAIQIDFRRLCVESLKPYEAHVLWQREFLSGRARCYELSGHPLAAAAASDLAEFEAAEPRPFGTGLIRP